MGREPEGGLGQARGEETVAFHSNVEVERVGENSGLVVERTGEEARDQIKLAGLLKGMFDDAEDERVDEVKGVGAEIYCQASPQTSR